ncbi:PASTA domain-containing protein, partial [bacterium]|nr:PASTA domain-containing protein [bacterium]
MKYRGSGRLFIASTIVLLACRASGQFLVVPPKAEVIVPKVTGMMREEAEKILTDAGLKVITSEQEDPDFPAGTVLSQRPAAGKKASAGDEVLLLLTKSKGEPASAGKKTANRVSVPDVSGKSFSDAFGQLRRAGFMNITPQPVKSSEPKETVIGLLADAKPVDPGILIPGESEIVVLVSNGLISTAVTSMGGTASQTINTDTLVMTGIRQDSVVIQTEPLVMTGIRSDSLVIQTDSLVMTGIRQDSIVIQTEPLVMTGIRSDSLVIQTDSLVMTG